MAEALDHYWMSEPSSQEEGSQRYPLGGDSVFEIESFDEDYDPDNEPYAAGDWSRPMTASGTNLESGMGGLHAASIDSADDFSQPLQQLKLKSSIGNMSSRLEPVHDSSPPSPPLTDERMDTPPRRTPTPSRHVEEAAPVAELVQNGESSLLTPDESFEMVKPAPKDAHVGIDPPGTATKRKARDLDPFSSGSLSPPPTESIELASPDKSSPIGVVNGTNTPDAEDATMEPAVEARSVRRTTRSTVQANKPVPTATRGRKSMRIR